MNSLKKGLITAAAAVLLGVLLLFPAYAGTDSVGSVSNVRWQSDDEGVATVTWEYKTTRTNPRWKVRLRRGTSVDDEGRQGKPITRWITVDKNSIDFSTVISRKGTGVYIAEVFPEEGDETEDRRETKKEYIVDGEELAGIKKWVKEQQTSEEKYAKVFGWIAGPNGSWTYHYKNGSWAVGWQQIDGQTYYFSTNHLMLTGWQVINNRWYYFDTDKGQLLRNGISPDGYTVNAEGMLCIDGVPVDAGFQPKNTEKNAAKTLTDLTRIKINSKETKVDPNVVRPMKVTSDGKFSVETYEFSQPYEQWQPGVPVTVSCTICANTGYCFTDSTQVTFNRGSLISYTGNSVERVVVYTYYPRLVLESPQNLVLCDDGILSWTPVQNAVRYILRVEKEGERQNDIYVTTNSYDFSEYAWSDFVSFSILAIARESVRNYYYDSFETKVEDLDKIRVEGSVTQKNGSLIYRDSIGDYVSGWVEMNGNWYHFTNGHADKGWWQDTNGLWYYFDRNFHMVTGELNDNGTLYFLNDGSNPNVPLGALVQ